MATQKKAAFGSLRERSKGRWEIAYQRGVDASGKPVRVSETVKGNKADAERRRRELANMKDTGGLPTGKSTLAEWLETWLDLPKKRLWSVRTRETYETAIAKHINPVLGRTALGSLRSLELEAFEHHLSPGNAPQVHAILKAALGTAVRHGLIPKNPILDVETPTRTAKAIHAPSVSGVKDTLTQAKAEGHYLFPAMHLVLQRRIAKYGV